METDLSSLLVDIKIPRDIQARIGPPRVREGKGVLACRGHGGEGAGVRHGGHRGGRELVTPPP
eukprot:3252223-Heterocapsa_arctica.AAC.1